MKLLKKIIFSKAIFFVCLITSLALAIGGFFVPPKGVIDGSVLTAMGEFFGFATLAELTPILKSRSAKLTHGKTSIEISDNEEKEDNN